MVKSSGYFLVKELIRRTTRALGFEISRYSIRSSEELLLKTILRDFKIRTILDVGANEGQYAELLFDQDFQGDVFSFEPIPSVFKKLENASKRHPSKWHTLNVGAGSSVAEQMLNVTENLASSSIYEVSAASLDAEPATRITHQEKIQIITIDSFISSHPGLQKQIMLKLDIQGYELEALKGTERSLNQFSVVQIELSFTTVYQGAPQYLEVISWLKERNFELFTLIPVFISPTSGQMLQADGIFVKR